MCLASLIQYGIPVVRCSRTQRKVLMVCSSGFAQSMMAPSLRSHSCDRYEPLLCRPQPAHNLYGHTACHNAIVRSFSRSSFGSFSRYGGLVQRLTRHFHYARDFQRIISIIKHCHGTTARSSHHRNSVGYQMSHPTKWRTWQEV